MGNISAVNGQIITKFKDRIMGLDKICLSLAIMLAEPPNGSACEASTKRNAIYIGPYRRKVLSLAVCNAETPPISKMATIGATVHILYSTWCLHCTLSLQYVCQRLEAFQTQRQPKLT